LSGYGGSFCAEGKTRRRMLSIGDMVMLAIGGQSVRAEIEDEGSASSLHTGRTLRILRVRFQVQDEALNDAIVERLKNGNRITLDDGGTTTPVERTSNSWSYSNGVSSYSHNVDLREVEDIKPASVELRGLNLVPYEYEERLDHDGIVIEMKVRLTQPENELLEEHIWNQGYFPVTRHGLEERPREMRFGKCVWSEDGQIIKQRLVLIEKVIDEIDAYQDMFGPEDRRTWGMTAETREMLEALLALLTERNVLLDGDIEDIRTRVETGLPRRVRQLFRAHDIDQES
jgi:hypothetical protein